MGAAEALDARIREIIGEMCPLGARTVRDSDRLSDDLGYDSVAFLELALALEAEFELEAIDEDEAGELATVADIETLVRRLCGVAAE
ncbi:phosphopantetheine-binding protein [Streptomyces sp. SAJ15]|uniref:phosphopantetheine-binding protein n=1 Tax=Streptomyces sp. SAJ15 TaxID=2011095 RepID=UPI001185CCE8|nr:phosphopantetheine-binding protein [Streptomyces sp. SAJ15]TVL87413.1 hypothetical protein CD790_33520 [Streptomyces sp. SAJ15]